MAEASQTHTTFPRRGSNYVALPQETSRGRVVSHSVQTIRATPEQVYDLYARPEMLPHWQEGVLSVTPSGKNQMKWIFRAPGTNETIQWTAEVVEADRGRRHVSRIVDGPFKGTTDTLLLDVNPVGRGTTVTMISDMVLPGGALSNFAAGLVSRSPERLVVENLRHLKEFMETGEIPTVDGQPNGPRGVIGKWKSVLFGENIPAPRGAANHDRMKDQHHESSTGRSLAIGSVAVLAGAAAVWGVKKLNDAA